jgi:cytoskeleton protein RodZ
MEEPQFEQQTGALAGIGDQLRAAREARGMTLEQIAAETRIPQRQLASLEAGDFAALPGRTYAIGFARTYARVVGLDSEEAAAAVRHALDADEVDPRQRPASFEPGDPARVPSRMLGWLSVLAVLLVLAGLFAFFRPYFAPAAQLPSLVEQQQAEQRAAQAAQVRAAHPAAAQAAPTGGAVVFTALDEGVWVRFYDGAGKRLMEKTMAKGETYTVPAEAQNPQLRTGRPEALGITIGGRPVAKLSDVQKTMKDVPVTAQALIGRAAAAPTASAPPAAPAPSRPAPASSPSPTT